MDSIRKKFILKKILTYMSSLKEIAIRNYIQKIDWKRDNWSYQKIETDMQSFLGERPTIEVSWKKDVMINEVTGEAKEIKRLDRVGIIFTDTDDKYKKIEIIVE